MGRRVRFVLPVLMTYSKPKESFDDSGDYHENIGRPGCQLALIHSSILNMIGMLIFTWSSCVENQLVARLCNLTISIGSSSYLLEQQGQVNPSVSPARNRSGEESEGHWGSQSPHKLRCDYNASMEPDPDERHLLLAEDVTFPARRLWDHLQYDTCDKAGWIMELLGLVQERAPDRDR